MGQWSEGTELGLPSILNPKDWSQFPEVTFLSASDNLLLNTYFTHVQASTQASVLSITGSFYKIYLYISI